MEEERYRSLVIEPTPSRPSRRSLSPRCQDQRGRKRKVNKSYAKMAADTINKDLGYRTQLPPHKSRETQAWLLENLPYHWSPDLWPPSSPDCNPLDYFF
ncbi:Hypothetical protein FKW44_018955 [Caligus rogercresseyi]|uniref:Uncharacterized protein n=1 Tax=Caligus rogercresseyi TaxID=217165 RepID=A0A7T8GVS0_CALRO|nr:Hypothetical protein FKW44_018955 [Caligus rogercresseyi]